LGVGGGEKKFILSERRAESQDECGTIVILKLEKKTDQKGRKGAHPSGTRSHMPAEIGKLDKRHICGRGRGFSG